MYQLSKQKNKRKTILVIYIFRMELDPITKWLVRISSSILIFLGLILVIAIPLLALKASSTISLIQETIQNDLKDILTGLISKL